MLHLVSEFPEALDSGTLRKHVAQNHALGNILAQGGDRQSPVYTSPGRGYLQL